MYLVYLLNLVILTNYVTAQWTLNLIDLNTFPLARCLDGTPAGYYISPGTGDDAANDSIFGNGSGSGGSSLFGAGGASYTSMIVR